VCADPATFTRAKLETPLDTTFMAAKAANGILSPLNQRISDHSAAATTGATHGATPSHANPIRHKHSAADSRNRIRRRVDKRSSRNQQIGTPSPNTPTLVENLAPKVARRRPSTMLKRSLDAFARSPLQGLNSYYHFTRTSGEHYQ
jgi:hypothetical protein